MAWRPLWMMYMVVASCSSSQSLLSSPSISVCENATYKLKLLNKLDADNDANPLQHPSNVTYRLGPEWTSTNSHLAQPGGMSGLYSFANHFINVVVPRKNSDMDVLTLDIIDKISVGNFGLTSLWPIREKIVKIYSGLLACICIGAIFILIMCISLVAYITYWCCCCCLTNQSKPKRSDVQTANLVNGLSVALLVLSILILAGGILLLANSTHLHSTAPYIDTTVRDAIMDARSFLDNLMNELQYALVGNMQITISNLWKKLQGVKKSVVNSLNQTLEDMRNITESLVTNTRQSKQMFHTVKDEAVQTRALLETYKRDLNKWRLELESISLLPECKAVLKCNKLFSSYTENLEIKVNLEHLELPDELSDFGEVRLDDFNVSTEDLGTGFNMTDIKYRLDYFSTMLSNVYKKIESVLVEINLNNTNPRIGHFIEPVESVSYSVTIIMGVVIILIVLSIFSAIYMGYRRQSNVVNSRVTVAKSILNVVIVLLMFLSIFMMVTCMLLFVFSSAAKQAICEPLQDSSLTLIDQLFDVTNAPMKKVAGVPGSGSFLGKLIFDKSDMELDTVQVLRACHKNKAIFSLIDTEQEFGFSISSARKKIKETITSDVTDILKNIPNDLAVRIFNHPVYNTINQTIDALNNTANVTSTLLQELEKNVTTTDVRDLSSDLRELSTESEGILSEKLEKASISGEQLSGIRLAKIKEKMKNLALRVSEYELLRNKQMSQWAELQVNLHQMLNISSLVEITRYTSCLMENVLSSVISQIRTSVGRCGVAWEAYHSTVFIVCDVTLNGLNGIWFSLGWCLFFFVPVLILSVLLVKTHKTQIKKNGRGSSTVTPQPS